MADEIIRELWEIKDAIANEHGCDVKALVARFRATKHREDQPVPLLLQFPERRFWVDYDAEADVLYISFRHPQKATDTEMTEEGILLRYKDDELVGITILDASTRSQ